MSALRIAPAELLRGDDAVEALAGRLRHTVPSPAGGTPLVLLVHGEHGYPVVRGRLDAALGAARVEVVRHPHQGPCRLSAIEAIATEASRAGADWVLGVGGGRVVDVGKGAALAAGVPYAALPTSPATCAATAPTVVLYDDAGRHLEVREDGASAAVAALDASLLASAPDRLLAAGIADAWAKVHEVRLTNARCGPGTESAAGARPGAVTVGAATSRAALALLDDLAVLLAEHARPALAAGPSGELDGSLLPQRRLVAEAVVAYPGLIGGLAGADVKLALAHPLHDALTAIAGSHAALHGEKVAFGTLVQILVAGRNGLERSDAERGQAMHAEAAAYAELGLVCHLEALGCGAARTPAVEEATVRWALADPYVRQALPELTFAQLVAAMRQVDAWLRARAGLDG